MLAASAMFSWTIGRLADDADPALARALADLSFLAGGPGYAITFALLVAGISIAGTQARVLTWIGLLLGVLGVVSAATLLAEGFAFLLPVVRFGGLIWLVVYAAMPPREK